MGAMQRIERALESALQPAEAAGGPRIRPQLVIAVARACGDDDPALADGAAAAVELLHCASLVHDDLPCFDAALTRRGRPSVHCAFGERLAVLSGDALIVLAFQHLGASAKDSPQRLPRLLATLASGVGMPFGIAAGQGWECEARPVLRDYQRAKTGALFAAATAAGAEAAGQDAGRWRALGEWLGEAYQVADDIRDVIADPLQLGKPVGRDAALGRPSAAIEQGLGGALGHFDTLVRRAVEAVPACRGAEALRTMVRAEAQRLVPRPMRVETAVA
jgi:geranylgeranyl diphosphate synthase type II